VFCPRDAQRDKLKQRRKKKTMSVAKKERKAEVAVVVATWVMRSGKRQLEGLWVARESRV
jgi:hypothetical protein